jgi:hypothetical protein
MGMGRPKGSKTRSGHPPLRFKQSEVERAIRGVQSRSLPISRVEVDPISGRISIITDKPDTGDASKGNPWDKVLPHGNQA